MRDRGLERRFERFRKHGDVGALGQVFDGAAPELLRVATNLATGLSEAEDLVQATFLTAIERAPSWDRSARLMPWLLGILVNHAHEARRAKARERGAPALDAPDSARAPHERAAAAELSASLTRALRTIPEPYRAVLQPFLVEGRGALEIAHSTGRAPGTVRMQIHRGLERLRRALPAGLSAALALHLGAGRGLAAVRLEIVAHASTTPAVLAAASATAGAAPFLGGILGTLSLMKNLALATVAVALAAGVAWIAWPDDAAKAPLHVAPDEVPAGLEPARDEPLERALPSASSSAASERPSAQRVEAGAPEATVVEGSLFERSLAGVRGRLLTHHGEPVPETEVTLLELHPGMFLRAYRAIASGEPPAMEVEAQSARTDSEGRFRLHGVRTSGLHALGVDLGGPRGTIQFVEHVLNSGASVEIGDVTLAPAGRARGRVVDEQGRAIAGARVRVAKWPDWVQFLNLHSWQRDSIICAREGDRYEVVELPAWVHAWEPRLPIPTAISDAEGRFTLTAVPAGPVAPLVDQLGRLASLQAEVRIDVDGEHELGDLVLRSGRSVAGRIVDGAGKPRMGVEVRVGAAVHEQFLMLSPPVFTGADGRFVQAGVAPEVPIIIATRTAPGLAWRFDDPREVEAGELELALADDAQLELHVMTASGEPVPHAEVSIAPAGPLADPDVPSGLSPLRSLRAVERPALGVVVLRGASPGRHVVVVSAEGCANEGLEVELAPGANRSEVRLQPACALRVQVLADENGEALERCDVSVLVADKRGWALDGGDTDARGEVLLARVPEAAPEGLLLRVEHPGFAISRTELAAGVRELTVRLTRGGSLLARAVRGGRPPESPVFFEIESQLVKGVDVMVYGGTDAQGLVRVERLMPAKYRYRVYERFLAQGGFELIQSFAEHPDPLVEGEFEIAEGAVTELDVDLNSPSGVPAGLEGSLSGRVTLDGVPLAGVELQLHALDQRRSRDTRQESSALGEFEYMNLPPGEYWLICSGAGSAKEKLGDSFQHYERFELASAEHRQLDLDWTSRSVEVLVRSAEDGRALAGVTAALRIQGTEGSGHVHTGTTDASGIARLLVLGEGQYHLSASHDTFGQGAITGTLGAQDKRLTLDLALGVPCAGTIRVPSGLAEESLVNAQLYVYDHKAGIQRDVELQLDIDAGEFRIVGLAPGKYSAQLYLTGTVLDQQDFTLPEGGSETLELEFHVIEPGRDRR